ncbi:MAG: 4Fe-4S dicluster domain-containing protein [Acidobacteriota bacterium]
MHAPDSGRARTLDLLRTIGLGVFVLAFAIFVLTLATADYSLDDATLASIEASGAIQKPQLFDELRALDTRSWSSVVPFVGELDRAIANANQRGANIQEWEMVGIKTTLARAATGGPVPQQALLFFLLTFGLGTLGALLYFLPRLGLETPGIKNDRIWFHSMKARGWLGIAFGVFLIAFYILLYFWPFYITNWIRLADPLSHAMLGKPADRWFFYGVMYTFCVVVMGVRMMLNHRHSRYQLVRTVSVMFFQLGFAFLIPNILAALNRPSFDPKNAWPLNYSVFADYSRQSLMDSGAFGWGVLFWMIALALVVVPLFAFLWGKRWYCSWVCGCGGLAETLGDPYRHLSDKSLKAWRVERWMVHAVLVFAVVMTGLVVADVLPGVDESAVVGGNAWKVRNLYGFLIGSIFAGVVGTGFYPFMGSRVWCRFGCPLAAILGIVQRFKSRFRITTNGGQCISCGNCSTYCEMGIDVRWYAQRGQNIVRASCVGCGICSQVCPRGVLRLENGPTENRIPEPGLVQIGRGQVEIG